MALADRLYYEGEFEEAIAVYSAVAERSAGPERLDALWALARSQYQQGDNNGSEQTIRVLMQEEIGPELERLAVFLLGTVEFAQGDIDEAEDAFKSYVNSGGSAVPYGQLRLAEIAARGEDHNKAADLSTEALLTPLPPSVRTAAQFELASYQEDAGDVAAALATYTTLAGASGRLTPRGEALWLAADLAYRSGDGESARQSIVSLITLYPWHARALEALDHPALTFGVTLRDRALVLFEHRLNTEATEAFNAVLADPNEGTSAAASHYHLGILAERADNYQAALVHYDAAIALPGGPGDVLMGQSLWDKGTVLERLGRLDEAVAAYASIVDASPNSDHVREGLFRAGLLRFQQGLMGEASVYWQRLLDGLNEGETEARAAFWLAKAAEALSDQDLVVFYLDSAVAAEPLDYYGLRARALLAGEGAFPGSNDIQPTELAWGNIERWLAGWTGPETTAVGSATPSAPVGSSRALELLHAGLVDEADIEFHHLIDTTAGEPWLLYRLLRTTVEEGRTPVSAPAAARLAAAHAGAPSALLSLAYPAVYADLVNKEVTTYGFSPYLLLALVRQESYYDPNAHSPADANGLTQVIPGTAGDIAEALGETDFRIGDLFRPNVSLHFGAYYLSEQLELFDGDVSAALAAYNGGPGNSLRWDGVAGGDPDLFLETIEFSETRAYVELVLEHYAAYLYAHGLADRPSLPLP